MQILTVYSKNSDVTINYNDKHVPTDWYLYPFTSPCERSVSFLFKCNKPQQPHYSSSLLDKIGFTVTSEPKFRLLLCVNINGLRRGFFNIYSCVCFLNSFIHFSFFCCFVFRFLKSFTFN